MGGGDIGSDSRVEQDSLAGWGDGQRTCRSLAALVGCAQGMRVIVGAGLAVGVPGMGVGVSSSTLTVGVGVGG
jgi:hypothetical protein